jgi:alpha-D-ribose 1-methylphosphonate 5-triphosphate synthase subunit PhnG
MTTQHASDPEIAARRRALGLLARATPLELATALADLWPDVQPRELRPADTGLVMLRGRAGGDGAPFNLGEASVSRAVIELPTGERGFGHLLGRDLDQARRIATLDALWQRARDRSVLEARVLGPIASRLAAAAAKTAAETAATRVDFFTLVRGEDAA